ncbi:hypothetical protein L9F63_011152, partial [Diploptera punctata]
SLTRSTMLVTEMNLICDIYITIRYGLLKQNELKLCNVLVIALTELTKYIVLFHLQ